MRTSLFLTLTACSGADDAFVWPESTADAVATYARIADATYEDSLVAAEVLDTSLATLVATPSPATLQAARDAWRASREPYLQSEAFRFYDGPIDDPDDGPEGLINAWPLDEQYIDYVEGDDDAGLVNATDAIDGPALVSLNEQGGEKNIATGYHAIEFLLWGQDHDPDGPGDRPHTDYLTGSSGTAANQDRRATYLSVAGDLLVEHLGGVREQWAEDGAYRSGFEAAPEDSFGKLLTGLIVLSGFETGGERLQASLDSGDQEDEHSC
ncbi:MAG: iron-regulated protein, partial [Myxococcales bacterium]|nr:iron-regulated protein [Myxococcales bacterium]